MTTPDIVYVVEFGTLYEGGVAEGVFASVDGSMACAATVMSERRPLEWSSTTKSEHVAEWENGCDYVIVRRWQVQP